MVTAACTDKTVDSPIQKTDLKGPHVEDVIEEHLYNTKESTVRKGRNLLGNCEENWIRYPTKNVVRFWIGKRSKM